VLRAHGIVSDRRDGNVVYYTLLTPCVVNFFSCASQVSRSACDGARGCVFEVILLKWPYSHATGGSDLERGQPAAREARDTARRAVEAR